MLRIYCPELPDEWSGAEGCGEPFLIDPSEIVEDEVECPVCGLSFDLKRTNVEEVPDQPPTRSKYLPNYYTTGDPVTKYVFIDCSGSTKPQRDKLIAVAALHNGEKWGFSSHAWPIRTPDDFRKGNQGTNFQSVLDIVGDEPAVLITDFPPPAILGDDASPQTWPANITVVTV